MAAAKVFGRKPVFKDMKKVLWLIGGGGILFTLGGGLLTGLRLQKLAERQTHLKLHSDLTQYLGLAGAARP